MKVVWSPLAQKRAREFVRSVRGQPSGEPWRWLQRMLAVVGGLESRAARGFAVPELLLPRVAQVVVEPCRIIYKIDRDCVVILTLRSARKKSNDCVADGNREGVLLQHGEGGEG